MDAGKGSRRSGCGYHPAPCRLARRPPAPAHALSACSSTASLHALAGDAAVVDAAALAGDPPDGDALVAALREQVAGGRGHRLRRASSSAWPSFAGSSQALVALAAEREATVVLALPNDAVADDAAGRAPQRLGRGRGRRAAPACCPTTTLPSTCVALRGAALVPARRGGELDGQRSRSTRAPTVPAGFVLAFGPRAPRLAPARRSPPPTCAPSAPASARGRPSSRSCARASPRSTRARSSRPPRRPARRERRVKVAFLVNDLQLSGGVGVVVAHARQLHDRHGFDVTLVLAREQEDPHWSHEPLEGLPVVSLDGGARRALRHRHLDVVGDRVRALRAARRAIRVVRAEPRGPLLPPGERRAPRRSAGPRPAGRRSSPRRAGSPTRSPTCGPSAPCYLVRNGIDKGVFAPPARLEPRVDGPLRVLVEGNANVWFKGVNEAVAAVGQMSEPHHLTVVAPQPRRASWPTAPTASSARCRQRELAALYAESDVLVKLSRVEGMYGPPLEAFHMGATCVTTEVTGHEEYVEHGVNALVCDWDDLRGTARQLDLLAPRPRAAAPAAPRRAARPPRTWPTWEQVGAVHGGRAARDPARPSAGRRRPRSHCSSRTCASGSRSSASSRQSATASGGTSSATSAWGDCSACTRSCAFVIAVRCSCSCEAPVR